MKAFLLGFFCVIIRTVDNALVFQSEPKRLSPGRTKTLVLKCFLSPNKRPSFKILHSLVLSREDPGSPNASQELSSLKHDAFNQSIESSQAPKGSPVITEQPYITFTLPNPSLADATKYKCEAQWLTKPLQQRTWTAYVTVGVDAPTVKMIVEELALIKQEMLKMSEFYQNLTQKFTNKTNVIKKTVSKLQDEKELFTQLLFHASPVYNGHRYYFSKRQFTVEVDVAQAYCAYHGGYLAEIDDTKEFRFVVEFLQNFDSFKYVYVGITDSGHEGLWVNMHSRRDTKFLPWSPGEPNAGADQNCACMDRDLHFKYVDGYCYSPDAGVIPIRYLCEVGES
ncbi:C-type lectin domain family 3 member A-like isoform X2 [Biomphalaria glabrata]|nr:C-type lectin domain family 3 member A-like isoform X2 [Biomphalaria glabrata]